MKYIYDLETYVNFFLASFKCLKTGKYYEFEISDRKSEINQLRKFLSQPKLKLIGYNNVNFDYPVLHNTILKDRRNYSAQDIFRTVEIIINEKYSSVWDKYVKIPQLDLFKIWHYDNKNKATSLKWLEFAMRMKNVEDLPYKPGTSLTPEQMNHTIEYCRNDLDATEAFFLLSQKHISIRQFYTKLENINLMNASEIMMSKQIFSKYLAKAMNITTKELKGMRTLRDKVEVKDVIFDYVKFEDEINQQTLDFYNNSIWIDTSEMTEAQKKKYAIKRTVKYKNVIREYAEGGLHSFGKPGIYESDNEYILVDVDFASYYPHLSFRNGLHPEHIPAKIFNELYEGFYIKRKEFPKSDPRNYVLKIILNGSYGLSKDKYAFLYDPKWQLAITVNGQLLLTLLTENIFKACKKDVQIIFENTDGAMYRIHRSDYDNLQRACKTTEDIVNIPLETEVCQKIIARDVNNYINVIKNEKIKFKGCFEIDRDYHKNHSKRIVSLALANHYLNGVSVEDTVLNHLEKKDTYDIIKDVTKEGDVINYSNHGIFDFCIGAKMKRANKLYSRTIKGVKIVDKELSKTNRYYVSNDGCELIKKLPPTESSYLTDAEKHNLKVGGGQYSIFDLVEDVKVNPSDRESNIEAGWKCSLFNIYEDKPQYDINYDYYIQECKKIINKI